MSDKPNVVIREHGRDCEHCANLRRRQAAVAKVRRARALHAPDDVPNDEVHKLIPEMG